MSAVAAPAALPRPRSLVGGAGRRGLRLVPAGPVPKRAAGHPLSLGPDARARLGGAGRALLGTAGLKGASDAVRLAVLVLASRTPSETGEVEIRTAELGRWIGLSRSRTATAVVPALKKSGLVSVVTDAGEFGQDDGLLCRVLPMWAGQGVPGHPLNLAKKELATFLRLLEAVMAPGWVHRDGSVTPAGLLGARTGRGAATDRLALLLLVLEARENGWVRQCGGAVDTGRGRAAATLARLLGCKTSAGERVLERLENMGLVLRPRARTASRLNQRGRLVVPAVAAAHGHKVSAGVQEQGAEDEGAGFSDPDGPVMPGESPDSDGSAQVSDVEGAGEEESSDPDVAGILHADHPHVGTPLLPHRLCGGFSGEGRGGQGRRPERACAGEDQAVDDEESAAGSVSAVAEGGPLRGEKPKAFPVDEGGEKRAAGVRPTVVGWDKAQQRRRVDLPVDLRLRVALEPVVWLWKRLSGWQQDQVEAAAKAELVQLAGLGLAPEGAPQLLAGRLTDRLAETGGEALVNEPYGWLMSRGLVQRPACSDPRCDDGIRLDTGGDCASCGNVIHSRRSQRTQIAAQIDRDLPALTDDERRRLLESRLREQAAIEAQDFVWRTEQARAQEAERAAARVASAEQAERERQAVAAAEAERRILPCEDCGQQRSGGLCEACGYRRRTEVLIVETGLVAATWSADLTDQGTVAAVTDEVRTSLLTDITRAQDEVMAMMEPGELDADPAGVDAVLAFTALQTVEAALPEYRSSALGRLGRTGEADTEAAQAYRAERGRRWFQHNPDGADAVAAATKAGDAARERTAQHLLAVRLKQLREQALARTGAAVAAPWRDRLPELAARPLHTDTAGAVIA
ncbi:hypothetical protein ACFUIV_27510 [Streptomyces anulatus]|uniref:hypothetical protein n=1 Tax=Streptomyces anulatus TaxID=1892 RepID=UPI00363CA2CD